MSFIDIQTDRQTQTERPRGTKTQRGRVKSKMKDKNTVHGGHVCVYK